MDNTLYLLVGKSGSGKTTIANSLEELYDLTQLQSYTTRPPRYDNETGHIFITDDEFDALTDIIGYTEYDGYRYCSTQDQLDESDIYIVDVPGVDTVLNGYDSDRRIEVLYFDADEKTRVKRMTLRNDDEQQIAARLKNDGASNWYQELQDIIRNSYRYDTYLTLVPAYKSEVEVIDFILENCIDAGGDLF